MKTTVEIADALLAEARRLAARRGTTMRALIEEGLRRITGEGSTAGFHLEDASFGGNGLRPEVADNAWGEIRHRIYEGRGG